MLVVSSNDLPGYRIDAVLGEVIGVTVREPGALSKLVTRFREPDERTMLEMSQLLWSRRKEAVDRMIWQASQRQANAIVAFRFDSVDVAPGWTENCAYGTAVCAVPLTEQAKQQFGAASVN